MTSPFSPLTGIDSIVASSRSKTRNPSGSASSFSDLSASLRTSVVSANITESSAKSRSVIRTVPKGSFYVISITTRHGSCGFQPNSRYEFIHANYSPNRKNLACACAEWHTKITCQHITQPKLKINFSVTAHSTLYMLILLKRAMNGVS